MTQLCEIPLEQLRAPEGPYGKCIYHWVDTLQTYWLRRPGLERKLTATFEASHPTSCTGPGTRSVRRTSAGPCPRSLAVACLACDGRIPIDVESE
ncbi:Imm49 family immunity protein [Streptomyces sp. NPDC002004]